MSEMTRRDAIKAGAALTPLAVLAAADAHARGIDTETAIKAAKEQSKKKQTLFEMMSPQDKIEWLLDQWKINKAKKDWEEYDQQWREAMRDLIPEMVNTCQKYASHDNRLRDIVEGWAETRFLTTKQAQLLRSHTPTVGVVKRVLERLMAQNVITREEYLKWMGLPLPYPKAEEKKTGKIPILCIGDRGAFQPIDDCDLDF